MSILHKLNPPFMDVLDAILGFLYDHIAKSGDLQARVKWSPNTVVLWDNRITAHVRSDLLFNVISIAYVPFPYRAQL